MNSEQRKQVRDSLIEQGFTRTGFTDDISGGGDYTETWHHSDGTVIEVKWASRERDVSAPSKQSPTVTGSGQGLRYPVKEGQVDPSVVAPFVGWRVSITRQSDVGSETITGFPVDAWRFSPTSLGIRLTGTLGGTEGGYIVLPDDEPWTIRARRSSIPSYRHDPTPKASTGH